MPFMLKQLMAVAAQKCPKRVAKFNECFMRTQSDAKCAAEELECLVCASKLILLAHQKKTHRYR